MGRIGPHEGRELALMRAGDKPLAAFWEAEGEDTIPDAAFAPFVDKGEIHRHEEFVTGPGPDGAAVRIRVVLFALPDQAARIGEALEILRPVMAGERKPTRNDDAELGRLLGYEERDVEGFADGSAAL